VCYHVAHPGPKVAPAVRQVPCRIRIRTRRRDASGYHFRDHKDRKDSCDEVHAVPQEQLTEGKAGLPGVGAETNTGEGQAKTGGDDTLVEVTPAYRSDSGNPQYSQQEKFRRPYEQQNGFQQWQQTKEEQCPNHTAAGGCKQAGAEGTSRLPLLRHWVAVYHSGRVGPGTWYAK